jgi:predicted Zn-dependent protease
MPSFLQWNLNATGSFFQQSKHDKVFYVIKSDFPYQSDLWPVNHTKKEPSLLKTLSGD